MPGKDVGHWQIVSRVVADFELTFPAHRPPDQPSRLRLVGLW